MSVIGWVWVLTGVVTFLICGAGLLLEQSIRGATGELPTLGTGWPTRVSAWLAHHTGLLSAAHLVLALVSLLAGWGLLRLRPWSRPLTLGLCWLSVPYALAAGLHLLGIWWVTIGAMADETPAGLQIGGSVLVVVMTLVLVVPLLLMIRYLGGESARCSLSR